MGERRRPAGWGTIVLGSVIVLAGLVATAAATTPLATPATVDTEDACADANGDGKLGVADGVQALRVVTELPSTCRPAGRVSIGRGVRSARPVLRGDRV